MVKSLLLRDSELPNQPRPQELIDQQYTILDIIGRGTFGKVYRILDKRDNKHYALKTVIQEKRYKNRQLSIMLGISHPNILRLLDHFYTNSNNETSLNLVVNLMPTSLCALLTMKRKKASIIEPTAIKLYAFQLLKALAYFNDINMGHRDLKPMNILIDPDTHQLHICDLGSAKVLKTSQTNVCYICSRYYRAPELLFGYCNYFTEIDMWSLGCILVEMVTKQPIFTGEDTLGQIIEIIKILGTPDETFLIHSSGFKDIKLPQLKGTSWKTILRKYECCPKFLDLLSRMLVFYPNKRIKPAEALMHQYFADITEPDYSLLVSKIPNLFDFTSNKFIGYEKEKDQILSRFGTKEPIYIQPAILYDQKSNPECIGEKFTS